MRNLVVALLLLLAGCNDRGAPPPPPPASGWAFAFGRPALLVQNGNEFSFSFNGAEPHMLLKATGPLTGAAHLKWRCEGCDLRPRQGSRATVSLIIVRRGNDWTADGPQVSYRWYWAGHPIVGEGEHTITVNFAPQHWTNVLGRRDDAAFTDALANASHIGLCFGDPGAGATCHGVTGNGKFIFTFSP